MTSAPAARRVLDRFAFGPTADQLTAAASATPAELLDQLLASAGTGLPSRVAAPTFTAPPEAGKGASTEQRKARNRALAQQRATLLRWWLTTAVRSEHQLTERLAWFWSGHFATSIAKVRSAAMMYQQLATFRARATGRFADLAHAVVVDPAMLVWLDGDDNRAGSPNENLSREFMELFALGPGGYTEDDVRAGARGLTGWAVDRRTGRARFVPKRHDDGPVTFLGRTGPLDATSYVDQVLAQQQSPSFVIGRLWFRLVSATPPDTDAQVRLRTAWGQGTGSGDIAAVLRALVAEPAFAAPGAALVKQPVEWLVGALRACRVDPAQLDDKAAAGLLGGLRALGQVPFAPPNVGGWPSGAAWLTAATAVARTRVARLVAAASPVPAELGSSAAARVDAAARVLGVSFSSRTRDAVSGVAGSAPDALVVALCSPEYVVST